MCAIMTHGVFSKVNADNDFWIGRIFVPYWRTFTRAILIILREDIDFSNSLCGYDYCHIN